MADLQDAVARRDPGERDETDHRRDGQRLAGDPQRGDRTDEGHWDSPHHYQRERQRAVAAVKDRKDEGQRGERQDPAGER